MRHGNKINHLGRKKGHRDALLKNLAQALIQHKRINTTLAKAKSLRTFIEPIITKSKENTTHSRRTVFSYLQNKDSVKELFEVIAEKVADRPGGYCRIIKTGFRQGDAAETAMIELVDFNEVLVAKTAKAGATRRGRRRSKGGSGIAENTGGPATAAAAAAATAAVATSTNDESATSEEE